MPAVRPRTRAIVKWGATALMVVGWGGALWSYLDHRYAAGVDPGFLTALTVAACATMVAGQWWLLPTRTEREEAAAIFALGFEQGRASAIGDQPKDPVHLVVVRRDGS